MFKLDLEKAEEPEIKLPSSTGSQRKQGNSRKTYTFASLSTLNSLIVWMKTNCGKFLKRWENQSILPTSWETCLQVKKQQLETDMEQQTGSRLGKENIKAVYRHLAYLTYMQSTSCEVLVEEAQAGIKIAGWNINNLRYADDTTLMAESEEELKILLKKVKEEWKSWLKT